MHLHIPALFSINTKVAIKKKRYALSYREGTMKEQTLGSRLLVFLITLLDAVSGICSTLKIAASIFTSSLTDSACSPITDLSDTFFSNSQQQ